MGGNQMGKARIPSFWKGILVGVASGIFGAVFGILAVERVFEALSPANSPTLQWLESSPIGFIVIPVWALAALLCCFVAAVALHEVGHVVAGLKAGFRFAFLLFWPLQIRRRGERGLTVKTKFRSGLGLGGLAGMTPRPGTELRRGYITLLAGGPAASLVGAIGGLSLGYLLGNLIPLAASLVWCFGLCSLFVFLLSIYPSRAGGFLSDGAALRLLCFGEPDKVAPYLAMMEISSAWSTGTRPASWNADSIARITSVDADDPLANRAPYIAFLNAADRADLADAGIWMDRMIDGIDNVPRLLQPQFHLMNAWLKARTGEPGAARNLLAKATGGLLDACEIAMVEAVILQAEGKAEEARDRARKALSLIEQAMLPDAHAFDRLQCESLLN